MSLLSTLGDIGKNLIGGAGSIASSLLGGIGSVVGAKMSADSAERMNAQNIKFQQEQNEIERERADSTLQRTVADAHKAGLSAFDAQSVPLGATSAPQNDVASVSSAMQSLGSSVSSAGTIVPDLVRLFESVVIVEIYPINKPGRYLSLILLVTILSPILTLSSSSYN